MSITAITIIDTMKKWVEEKHPIAPSMWLDASAKLNILRGDLDDTYFDLESELAQKKADLLTRDNMTVAKAESFIKADDRYKEMRKLGARIKQLEEFIKISKHQARLKNEEWVNQQ